MPFEWDFFKNIANIEKHGIAFEEAIDIFEDQYSIEVIDDDGPELRIYRIGLCFRIGLLVVIYCERNDSSVIRNISARRATKRERRVYEEGN